MDNPRYRAWIRTFPCVVCGSARRIEAAHTGAHGLGQKSDSMKCLPLCERCHRTGPQAYHRSAATFAEVHKLDIPNLIEQFNTLWDEKQRRRRAA